MGYRVAPIGLEKLSRIVAGRVARKAKGFFLLNFSIFFFKSFTHIGSACRKTNEPSCSVEKF
jgi:hypothetical protein